MNIRTGEALALLLFIALNSSLHADVCELQVSADMNKGVIRGSMIVQSDVREKQQFSTRGLTIEAVRGEHSSGSDGAILSEADRIEIDFSADFSKNAKGNAFDKDFIALIGNWHPLPSRPCVYHLKADLPAGFRAVSESERMGTEAIGDRSEHRFAFSHPLDQITLVASSDFEVSTSHHGRTELRTYFFKRDAALAKTYLDYAKSYLERYERLLGPFPYPIFSIVENRLPTGYSFPTFTLLGETVVNLPFIVKTSLGHEILHQWLGNGVYVDYGSGNWCEGLTTYLADYAFASETGEAVSYRKNLLIDMHEGRRAIDTLPLHRFESAAIEGTRPVGYAKSAMFFHMLRNLVGDDHFRKTLRLFINKYKYREASYEDLKLLMGGNGEEVSVFFDGWVHSTGAADPRIGKASAITEKSQWWLDLEIEQSTALLYRLPVMVVFEDGTTEMITVKMERRQNRHRLIVMKRPREIVLDPEYEVARRLSDSEIPARVSSIFSRPNRFLTGSEIPDGVLDELKSLFPLDEFTSLETGIEVEKDKNLILLGTDGPFENRYFETGDLDSGGVGFSIRVVAHPRSAENVIGQITARSREEFMSSFSRIRHYGKYARLQFKDGRNTVKEFDPVGGGIRHKIGEFYTPRLNTTSLEEFRRLLSARRVVHIGEIHDRYSHHLTQVEFMRELKRAGRQFAIGMEMFTKSNQKTLDDYIQGRIDERAFMKDSHYYEEWGFDYRLYRPIFDFARRNAIRIIALNADRSLVSKVAREGLASLSDVERALIPARIDRSNLDYAAFIREAFRKHGDPDDSKFDNFHTAQVIRDETMAGVASAYLKENPDSSLIVLAGGGHIMGGWGIPDRLSRESGERDALVMMDVPIVRNGADLYLYPKESEYKPTPVIGVILKEGVGGPVIGEVAKGSLAEKIGLRGGDTLLMLNRKKLRDPVDFRIELALENDSEIILTVKRDDEVITVRVLNE